MFVPSSFLLRFISIILFLWVAGFFVSGSVPACPLHTALFPSLFAFREKSEDERLMREDHNPRHGECDALPE